MRFRRRRVRTASAVEDEDVRATNASRKPNGPHLRIKITPPSVPSVSTLSLHSGLDSGLDSAHLRPPSVRPGLQRMPAYRPRSPTPSSRSSSLNSAPRSFFPPRSSSIKGRSKESRARPAIRSNPNSPPGSPDPLPNGQATEGGSGPGPTLSHRSHRAHQAHRGMANSPQAAEPCAETRAQTSECTCPAWPKCKLHDSRANGVAGDITGLGRQNRFAGQNGQNGHAGQNGQNGHAGPNTPEPRSLASRLHLTPSKHSRRASWSRTLKTARELHAARKWENPELGPAYLAKAYYTDLRSLNAEEKERRELARQAKTENGWMPLRDSWTRYTGGRDSAR